MAKRFFDPKEIEEIKKNPTLFYKAWTQKEALAKAVDSSIMHYLNKQTLTQQKHVINSQTWWLHTLKSNPTQMLSLACQYKDPTIIYQDINLENV